MAIITTIGAVRRAIITELNRAEREGVYRNSFFDRLRELVERHPGDQLFLHFSLYNKLGIYPLTNFGTPSGIYAYPLTPAIMASFKKWGAQAGVTFAGDRKYGHVFKVRPGKNVLTLDETDFPDEQTATRWYEKVTGRRPDDDKTRDSFYHHVRVNTPAGKFWYATFVESQRRGRIDRDVDPENPKRRSTSEFASMFRHAGIDGFIDPGEGIIYHEQPTQVVFFTKASSSKWASSPTTGAGAKTCSTRRDGTDPTWLSTRGTAWHTRSKRWMNITPN